MVRSNTPRIADADICAYCRMGGSNEALNNFTNRLIQGYCVGICIKLNSKNPIPDRLAERRLSVPIARFRRGSID